MDEHDEIARLRARVDEAAALGRDGRALDALVLLDATLPRLEHLVGPDDPSVRAGTGNADVCLSQLANAWSPDVRSAFEQNGPGHPETVLAEMRWAWWLARTSQFATAEQMYEPMRHRAAAHWPGHISTFRIEHNWLVVSAAMHPRDRTRLETTILHARTLLEMMELGRLEDAEAHRTRLALHSWERRLQDLRDGTDPFVLPPDAPRLGELLAPPDVLPPGLLGRPRLCGHHSQPSMCDQRAL